MPSQSYTPVTCFDRVRYDLCFANPFVDITVAETQRRNFTGFRKYQFSQYSVYGYILLNLPSSVNCLFTLQSICKLIILSKVKQNIQSSYNQCYYIYLNLYILSYCIYYLLISSERGTLWCHKKEAGKIYKLSWLFYISVPADEKAY